MQPRDRRAPSCKGDSRRSQPLAARRRRSRRTIGRWRNISCYPLTARVL